MRGRFLWRLDISLSRNAIHIRQLCAWSRAALLDILTVNGSAQERQQVRRLLWALEVRDVRRSALAAPLSRVFGIPVADLLHGDLTRYTLDDLRERYGFVIGEVVARGERHEEVSSPVHGKTKRRPH